MADRSSRAVPTSGRTNWPYQGAPQVLLLIAGLVTMAASFLPWISTPFGAVGVADAGVVIANAPTITLYAGFVATPGAVWRSARVVMVHALVLAVPAVALPLLHVGWALRRLPGLGTAWVPGPGLVLVLASGVVACYVAAVLRRRTNRTTG